MNGAISLIMLVLGALILISALRKWSELWKLRQQPEFRWPRRPPPDPSSPPRTPPQRVFHWRCAFIHWH